MRFSDGKACVPSSPVAKGKSMIWAILVSFAICSVTVVVHMGGLVLLMAFMRARTGRIRPHQSMARQTGFIMLIVFGLFAIHAVEIWAYALLYLALGEFSTLESALYFATSTFTTLGYGDVLLSQEWRLVGAIEGFNGFLLIGWSTAFLVTVIGRLRAIEFDWLDHHLEGD
ncbi:potassium channel family protein [Maricaulis salignorans]|uniref:Ion channel n=1 Tax=Maricaulis salignorans TaxID=144026 RepID=A0A1G9VV75_9PROT|nr:potassium channel family protein [Maricaulis salignorans]SDM75785.1 Ion channel [Maricaulis salignorans]